MLAAAGLGGLIGQVPMGAVIARVGERRVLIVASLLLAASTALLGVTSVALALASFRIAAGLGNAGWSLAYGAFISTSVAADVRGRASSTFGGVQRIAWLVGPIAGGFVAARFGFDTAFAVTGLVMATGIVPLLSSQVKEIMPVPEPREDHPPLRDIYRRNRGPLVAAGAVSIFVAAAREGRVVVIPLLGAALGLDLADVGILVAVGAASDMLLFPLAGWLMDRFTRLAASVPALTLLAIGLFVAAAATSPRDPGIGRSDRWTRQRHRGRHHADPWRRHRPSGGCQPFPVAARVGPRGRVGDGAARGRFRGQIERALPRELWSSVSSRSSQ